MKLLSKIRHRHADTVRIPVINVIVPDLEGVDPMQNIIHYRWDGCDYIGEHELIDPWTSFFRPVLYGAVPEQEPGYYLAICISYCRTIPVQFNDAWAHFTWSPAFEFIDLYVEG